MLDKETAQNLAKELKIDLFTIYREYLQLLFLKYLYSQKNSEKICFKGGTALRFLFDSFRFSEDLDFTSPFNSSALNNLVEKTVRDLNKEAGEVTFKKLKPIANSFSAKLSQRIEGFNFPPTIRLDFSLREKPLIPETSYLETIFPIGPYPLISHLSIKEMLVEKVRALVIRVKGRDIFDIWFLLSKKVPIDWKLVNKKMALYKKKANLKELISAIKKMPEEKIKQDLTKFLPLSHRSMVSKIKTLTLEKLTET